MRRDSHRERDPQPTVQTCPVRSTKETPGDDGSKDEREQDGVCDAAVATKERFDGEVAERPPDRIDVGHGSDNRGCNPDATVCGSWRERGGRQRGSRDGMREG